MKCVQGEGAQKRKRKPKTLPETSPHLSLQLPLLKMPGVFHFFGTRHLDRDRVDKEYHPVFLQQVHGDRIVSIGRDGWPEEERGDGLKTTTLRQFIAVSTADCVPILLVDPVKRVVMALHAGWRGSVLNIAEKGVHNLLKKNGSNPADLIAGLGPSIASCCFEVGPDVAAAIEKETPYKKVVLQEKSAGKCRLDLIELNRLQLIAAGLPAEQIQAANCCTSCDPERFTSYRRDNKKGGNMMSGIMLL